MSAVSDKLTEMKGQKMSEEEMVTLIRQVWSDAMSDNGAIWAKSNAKLQQAKADNPKLYTKALATAYARGSI